MAASSSAVERWTLRLICVVGQQGEEPLDLVDPGGRGRREVDVPARPLGEPVADQLGLVGGVVVHHEVDVEVLGDAAPRPCRGSGGTRRPGAAACTADHGPGRHVERGEQRRRAVPL